MVGTSDVNLICFLFLILTLAYIWFGEVLFIDSKMRKSFHFVLWFVYFWFVANNIFTLTSADDEALVWELIGLKKYSNNTILPILLFSFLLVQIRINNSTSLFHVVRFIKRDAEKSAERARLFKMRKYRSLKKRKKEIDDEIHKIREKVVIHKRYQKDVGDWIKVFGRREDDFGYAVIDMVNGQYDVVGIDTDDRFHNAPNDKFNGVEEIRAEKVESSEDEYLGDPFIQDTQVMRSKYEILGLKFIDLLKRFSTEHASLYTQSEIDLEKIAEDEPIYKRVMVAFIVFLLSHTTSICYFAIFLNQIYHANLLSSIPMFAVLLFGVIQRPRPSKEFWSFIMLFIEFTIILKFLFSFEWSFNFKEGQILPNDFVSILGIERTSRRFGTRVITELFILLSCVLHRGTMARLGLWKYLKRENELTDNSLVLGLSPVESMQTPCSQENREIQPRKSSLQLLSKFGKKENISGEDFYLAIFICDIIVFFLTIIMWSYFSGDKIQVFDTVLSQNTVPPLFAAIAILNFTLIVIDRCIYVSKSLFSKLILQFVSVFCFSLWIFFLLPITNNTSFWNMPGLQVWFFIKCLYWWFSGLQIKSGYPRLRLSNFLTKDFKAINRYLFMIYRLIPFVWEFRAFIDWTLTETSLDIYAWLKFEDIFAKLFSVKSVRFMDQLYNRKFGERQERLWKIAIGIGAILGLIILIWIPLIILSLPGATKKKRSCCGIFFFWYRWISDFL
jgi:hypothetical protein